MRRERRGGLGDQRPPFGSSDQDQGWALAVARQAREDGSGQAIGRNDANGGARRLQSYPCLGDGVVRTQSQNDLRRVDGVLRGAVHALNRHHRPEQTARIGAFVAAGDRCGRPQIDAPLRVGDEHRL